jgi:hypothetical protein
MEQRLLVRDQLLRAVVKKWFSFQHALHSGSVDEAHVEHAQLLAALNEYEYSAGRAVEVAGKLADQMMSSERVLGEKQEELKRARERSWELKQSYKQAKIARNNHDEYEKLAELVGRYPSREETMSTVTALTAEIEALEAEKKEMEGRLALKNGQFQLLLYAIRGLQANNKVITTELEEGEL